MLRTVKATYHNRTFVLEESCDIPEGAQVELIIQGPMVLPPEIDDAVERRRLVTAVVKRMENNPIPQGVAQLTRDELHERR